MLGLPDYELLGAASEVANITDNIKIAREAKRSRLPVKNVSPTARLYFHGLGYKVEMEEPNTTVFVLEDAQ